MRCFVLAFSLLAFSSTCVFSAVRYSPRNGSNTKKLSYFDMLFIFIVKSVNLLYSVCFATGYIHSGEIKIKRKNTAIHKQKYKQNESDVYSLVSGSVGTLRSK